MEGQSWVSYTDMIELRLHCAFLGESHRELISGHFSGQMDCVDDRAQASEKLNSPIDGEIEAILKECLGERWAPFY